MVVVLLMHNPTTLSHKGMHSTGMEQTILLAGHVLEVSR